MGYFIWISVQLNLFWIQADPDIPKHNLLNIYHREKWCNKTVKKSDIHILSPVHSFNRVYSVLDN
jgi:hypothetical protein